MYNCTQNASPKINMVFDKQSFIIYPYLNMLKIPDFGISTAILNITDFPHRWCKCKFRLLWGHVKSCNFPQRIEARRQYFYFSYKFYGIIGRKRLGQLFQIMIWAYYYLLNRIRLELGLDNAFWIQKYLTLLQTTFTFCFSHTKCSMTSENRTC